MTVVLRVKTTAGWSPMVQETGKQRGERQRQTPEVGDFFLLQHFHLYLVIIV